MGSQGPVRDATGDSEVRTPRISGIAGPEGHEAVEPRHIAEAIGYRSIDGSGHDQRIERRVSSSLRATDHSRRACIARRESLEPTSGDL